MKPVKDIVKDRPWVGWVLFFVTMAVVFVLGLFASSVAERRGETVFVFQPVKPIPDWEPRNEVWGSNYPREFETYRSTLDTGFHSKYGGSATIDYLKDDPALVVLWAGYPFSKDYNQGRGHYHAITDIRTTLRTTSPMPGTCWTCKSTDVPRLMQKIGPAAFYKAAWADLGAEIRNPIGCQDCHDPRTMNLRITRPALVEALQRQGKAITAATHQEMRSLVCAQCHVEYYFKGEGKYLTFPWDNGFSAEEMEAYYDSSEFTDWVHALSRAPMIKAQHPDYEVWKTGVHADRAVACADCHMPYKTEGGIKFTDHKIQSPLANISGSCQVCHRESEEKLKTNVTDRQDKIAALKAIVEGLLVKAHFEAKTAWDIGATEEEMKPALTLIRHAQWRWDWVAASNAVGFHSPLESARILGTAIDKVQESRVLLTSILLVHNAWLPVTIPDISTKEKAQAAVGLDMAKIQAEKKTFLETVAPAWDKKK